MKKTFLIALTASCLFACKDPDTSSTPPNAVTDPSTYEIKTGGNQMIEIDTDEQAVHTGALPVACEKMAGTPDAVFQKIKSDYMPANAGR